MSEVSWRKHALIFLALILNLWVGGDYIELWLSAGARAVFELTLIFGYMTLIIGMRAPLPWRRPRAAGDGAASGDAPLDTIPDHGQRDRDHDPTRGL